MLPDRTAARNRARPYAAHRRAKAGSTFAHPDCLICQIPERVISAEFIQRPALEGDPIVERRDMQPSAPGALIKSAYRELNSFSVIT